MTTDPDDLANVAAGVLVMSGSDSGRPRMVVTSPGCWILVKLDDPRCPAEESEEALYSD